MSGLAAFDRLHPLLQHHIVNGLGWRDLRPFQQEVIPALLDGQHAIVLAPTAGGKTEAAVFPAISRMLEEDWRGLSVLYVCPVKALINNLAPRMSRYLELVGRRVGVWHGDVSPGDKKRMRANPPDLLLTTPESLEVQLISGSAEPRAFFGGVRMVIVDEVHALAGDDRGWHLLGVLRRIASHAAREPQRVGLSATVGNPEELLQWLRPNEAPASVLGSAVGISSTADVQLDYVGSLSNAAAVISRLHAGEKRLCFVDSRARAEALTRSLRLANVPVWITQSSLSLDQRHAAEKAFLEAEQGVIVATSVLELGVDVGDLDRVIQIDSPASVASFLQRMGRTGRRAPYERNCLFLATSKESLLQAAGLLRLWEGGFVEPVVFPPRPYHVLAQQLMALMLETRGLPVADAERRLRGDGPLFADLSADAVDGLISHGLATGLFAEDGGRLWFGEAGEKEVGRRHFMELFSLVAADPMLVVRHGREELGRVPVEAVAARTEGPPVLLLAGRNWAICDVDWRRRVIQVQPAKSGGAVRWLGAGHALSLELMQEVRVVLGGGGDATRWSGRARNAIAELREDFLLPPGRGPLLSRAPNGDLALWTFAGLATNLGLALRWLDHLGEGDGVPAPQAFNTRVVLEGAHDLEELRSVLLDGEQPVFTPNLEGYVKFQPFLPDAMLRSLYHARATAPPPGLVFGQAWVPTDALPLLRV